MVTFAPIILTLAMVIGLLSCLLWLFIWLRVVEQWVMLAAHILLWRREILPSTLLCTAVISIQQLASPYEEAANCV